MNPPKDGTLRGSAFLASIIVVNTNHSDSAEAVTQAQVPPEPTRGIEQLRNWAYWLTGYAAYTLFHLIFLPYVIIRFIGRMGHGRYRGVIWRRFIGGTKPPTRRQDWTLIIASELGETRTAVHAAQEISKDGSPIAVLSQLSRIPVGLQRECANFPIGFAPFNSPHAALICLLMWRPKMVLFVEFSGNYHLAFVAKLLGIPTALINVNLPEPRLRRLQRKVLGRWQFSFIDAFVTQARTHKERLMRLGVPRNKILVGGIALPPLFMGHSPEIRQKWQGILQLKAGEPVVVAGSTYHEEELILIETARQLRKQFPELVLVLAPRQINRPQGASSALQALGEDYDVRSLLDRHERVAKTILLDTVGELRELYSVATVAFVGGSFVTHIGGHTPIEALAWGIPITIGPHFEQQEAAVYLSEQAGFLHICAGEEALAHCWEEAISGDVTPEELASKTQALSAHQIEVFEATYVALKSRFGLR